ncbi:MAG: GNAT family N-acetyltransferase [bacterium]|nr:GNAT family N-acetyltransferase [bacterium]
MDRLIRRAVADDADALTRLTIASKAYWGYSRSFMRKARPYLTVTPAQIADDAIFVLETDGQIAGYYQLVEMLQRPSVIWMESLFVGPAFIGKGVGSALFDHAAHLARSLGYASMELEADPNAEDFYLRKGAVRIGGRESGIQKGRVLPLMRITLIQDSPG